MGFHNPAMPWSELEARLSNGRAPSSVAWNGGGDGPALSAKRQPFQPALQRGVSLVPYAELHCRSNFSFLTGAAHPEELAEVAASLGLSALALTDRNGLYGVVRFAEAARAVGLPTVFGVELDCSSIPSRVQCGSLVVLAKGPHGYALLARAISEGQLAGRKGEPAFTCDAVGQTVHGACFVLTGGSDSAVVRALEEHGPAEAERVLRYLIECFGHSNVLVELWDQGDPIDVVRNDQLVALAASLDLECIATNNVAYAVPAQHRLATALTAVRHRTSLDSIDHSLPPAATAYLRSGVEQQRRFARYPGVVERTADIAREIAFDLSLVAPQLPPFPCPDGMNEMSYLRHLVAHGARHRYGEEPSTSDEDLSLRARAWKTIHHELDIIETLGFAGYFLVV